MLLHARNINDHEMLCILRNPVTVVSVKSEAGSVLETLNPVISLNTVMV